MVELMYGILLMFNIFMLYDDLVCVGVLMGEYMVIVFGVVEWVYVKGGNEWINIIVMDFVVVNLEGDFYIVGVCLESVGMFLVFNLFDGFYMVGVGVVNCVYCLLFYLVVFV